MDGLLCQIGQALVQGRLCIKMSQSSVPEHFSSQFEPASPVLNLAKTEWTAWKLVDCFKMDGLLCLIGQALAQGSLCIKMSQRSDTCPRRVTCQNQSAQCTRAGLIPIQACKPSAEPWREGVDCLKTSGPLQNTWTPLPDRPDTCPRQFLRHNESEQCTRACLISIRGHKPSAEPCIERVHCLKTGGLLQHGWTPLPVIGCVPKHV
jgi:hypothetical protein